jgi:hypothetical protein
MRFRPCPRERELNLLLGRGQWPQASSDELRAHVDGCRACRELLVVRQAFTHERNLAACQARLDSPGALWWRAQLRRRNAAIERISRPLLGADIFALAVCLASAAAYALWLTRRGFDWFAWLADIRRALHFGALRPDSWSELPGGLWMALSAVAMAALMGGVFLYFRSEKH